MRKEKESKFKTDLYQEIRELFPGSEVLVNDASCIQGFPDATVYFPNGKYFLLEGKAYKTAPKRPNQGYYVNNSPLSKNASFVHPDNKQDVLAELERRYNE